MVKMMVIFCFLVKSCCPDFFLKGRGERVPVTDLSVFLVYYLRAGASVLVWEWPNSDIFSHLYRFTRYHQQNVNGLNI